MSAMTSISVLELEAVEFAELVFPSEIALLAFSTAVVRASAATLAVLLASLPAAAALWALARARTWLSIPCHALSLSFRSLMAFLAAGVVA